MKVRNRRMTCFLMALTLIISAVGSPIGVAGLVGAETAGNAIPENKSWSSFQYNASNTGFHPTTRPPAGSPGKKWEFPADDKIGSSPIVVDDTIFVGSSTYGRLYAIDTANGTERWRFNASGAVRSPAYANRTVYFGTSNGTVYAIDASTGVEEWNRSVSGHVNSSVTITDGMVYVAVTNSSAPSTVRTFDADTGNGIWTHSVNGYANTTPAVADETVYVSASGQVMALNATSGTERWTTSVGDGTSLTAPTVGNKRVYVGTTNETNATGFVYGLHRDTGKVAWRQIVNSKIAGSPALARGTLYVTVYGISSINGIFAFNATTGTQKWWTDKSERVTTAPVIAEKTVFFGTMRGPMAIDAEENPTSGAGTTLGETRWFWEMGETAWEPRGNVQSAPVVVNNSMYVGFYRDHNSLYKLTSDDFDHSPVTEFEVRPTHPAPGELVVANASASYDIDGSITRYEWSLDSDYNYDDATGEVIVHRFYGTGDRTIDVQTIDNEGETGVVGAQTITVGGSTNFSAVNHSVSDTSVLVDETVTVNATVKNRGDGDGWMNVTLYGDGTAKREKTVLVLRGGNTTNVSFDVSFDGPGDHSVSVESLDPTTVTVRDETPPSAPASVSAPQWANETADVSWLNASDNGAVDHYEVQVDDRTWENASGTSTRLTGLTNGTHNVSVRAVDTAGNAGPAANATIQADTVAPSAPNVSAPDGWHDDDAVYVSWSNVTDDESGVAYYEFRADGEQWVTDYVWTSYEFTFSESGNHTVSVRGVDRAGNRGTAKTRTVRVDHTSPNVSIDSSSTSDTEKATLVVNLTDSHSGVRPENVNLTVDGQNVTDFSVVNDSIIYEHTVSDGYHTVKLTATDDVGNTVMLLKTIKVEGSSNGGGGGSGSGGGGGGSSNVPPPSVRVEVTKRSATHVRAKVTSARADAPASVSLDLDGDRTTFHDLQVTPKSEDAEARFFLDATVVDSPDAPSPPGDETLGYLRVKPTYVQNSELAGVTVEVRVPTDGVSPNEVTLYRYHDGKWSTLETEFVGKRGGRYAFRGSASGASLFAVGVTYQETTTATPTTGTTTAPESKTTTQDSTATTESALADATTSATPTTTTGDSGTVPGFGPLAALVALAVGAFSARRRE